MSLLGRSTMTTCPSRGVDTSTFRPLVLPYTRARQGWTENVPPRHFVNRRGSGPVVPNRRRKNSTITGAPGQVVTRPFNTRTLILTEVGVLSRLRVLHSSRHRSVKTPRGGGARAGTETRRRSWVVLSGHKGTSHTDGVFSVSNRYWEPTVRRLHSRITDVEEGEADKPGKVR